ncbi:MAG: hypothetical protein ACLRNW_24280 [Neglectibacter sp.]
MYTLLNEAFDISKQLAEAIERGDQVAIRILLSMRREPLENLRKVRHALENSGRACASAGASAGGASQRSRGGREGRRTVGRAGGAQRAAAQADCGA